MQDHQEEPDVPGAAAQDVPQPAAAVPEPPAGSSVESAESSSPGPESSGQKASNSTMPETHNVPSPEDDLGVANPEAEPKAAKEEEKDDTKSATAAPTPQPKKKVEEPEEDTWQMEAVKQMGNLMRDLITAVEKKTMGTTIEEQMGNAKDWVKGKIFGNGDPAAKNDLNATSGDKPKDLKADMENVINENSKVIEEANSANKEGLPSGAPGTENNVTPEAAGADARDIMNPMHNR